MRPSRGTAMRHVVPVIAFFMLFIHFSNATTVHLVFSNHLDVGFHAWGSLGFDNAVLNTYFDLHFPRAAQLADEARAAREPFHFVYTTHPFIITLFLDCPVGMGLNCPNATNKAVVTEAIKRGDISWHALPHNAQAEVYDPSLLQAAIDISRRLDKQFGFAPKVAMSQRDIPGLTRGTVPVLSRAGVKVLTVGVNGGSSPPGVPHFQPFVWRDTPSGEEILAMWHPGGYGGYWDNLAVDSKQDCIKAEGFDHVLCVAWRGDNDGPPATLDEVVRSVGHVKSEWPGTEVIVGNLEDYSKALLAAYKSLDLPVVTDEVGDTWIHGVSSDAAKLADYRTVLRLRNSCLASGECKQEDPKFQNFSRLLVKIPEHTWGLDTKDGLNDYVNWTNAQLQTCLKQRCPNYEAILLSWRRQYAYIPWAIEALGEGHPIAQAFCQERAYRHMPPTPTLAAQGADGTRHPPSTTLRWSRTKGDSAEPLHFSSRHWEVEVDTAAGTISRLQRVYNDGARKGVDWAGGHDASFLKPLYSTYDEDSFLLIWNTYFYTHGIPDWFSKDFGKLNCSTASPKRAETLGQLDEVHARNGAASEQLELQLRFSFPRWAVELAGAPETVWIMVKSAGELLQVEAVWEDKTATRLPEALWVQVKPGAKAPVDPQSWRMNKLGTWISPLEVILNGSHALHAVLDDGLTVDSLPAPTLPPTDPTPTPTPVSTTRRLLSEPPAAAATEPHRLPTRTFATGFASASGDSSAAAASGAAAGRRERLQLRTLDAGVVSPGKPTVFPIVGTQPDMKEGVAFNLINNIWGTNFVMWFPYEPEQATMRFRFELLVTELA